MNGVRAVAVVGEKPLAFGDYCRKESQTSAEVLHHARAIARADR